MLGAFKSRSAIPTAIALACATLALTVVVATPATAQTLLLLWSRGDDVAAWQAQLNDLRDDDISVDGIFGPVTAGATRQFQREAGIAVDGIVGPQTRNAMQQAQGGDGRPDPPGPEADETLRRGDTGGDVRSLQRQLDSLGYWVGPIDGIYGTLTAQAVIAFQKVHDLETTGEYGGEAQTAMADPRAPSPRSDRPGKVIEVDEGRQILLEVVDGTVRTIFHTSTGTEDYYFHDGRRYLADTPNGRHTVSRQIDGWRESRLGRLYRPKYFHRDGIAIHGYPRVPTYPASHGCVRVSMAAMDYLWTAVPEGTAVWVY